MESLWLNGQVVMQSQNQRSIRRSPPSELEQENENSNNLFMQEDEMATWLHYPLDEDNFCAQLELLENNMNMSSTQSHTNNPMVRSSHVTTEPGMTESSSRPPILPSRSELEGEEFFVSSRQDKRVMMKKLREWWLHALTKSCYNQHLPVEACEREAHVLSKFIW